MVEIYKRGQGAFARWTAIGSLGALLAFGAYELYTALRDRDFGGAPGWPVLTGGLVFVAGTALILWLTNMPRFADYLIASELELRKVSWPTKGELKRQTIVVVFTLLFFSLVLFGADSLFYYAFLKVFF